jgi:hypothetical protein
MIDDMVWAFAGLMALIAVYFVWRARVHNDVSKAMMQTLQRWRNLSASNSLWHS